MKAIFAMSPVVLQVFDLYLGTDRTPQSVCSWLVHPLSRETLSASEAGAVQ